MASKNDLSALKLRPKNTLGNLQAQTQSVEITSAAKAGRKLKPVAEKKTEIVGLRFTKSEINKIKQQAGLIPLATYLKQRIAFSNDETISSLRQNKNH